MPTQYTTSLRYWKGAPGDPAIRNIWGTALDTNFDLIEGAQLGAATIPIGGLSTYTLTTANGAVDQARPITQIFTGALTANCTVTLPNVPKFGMVINQTTGGFNVILTAGAGSTVTVPPENLPYDYYSDGATNVTVYQRQPGPRFGDWKFNSMATEGGGWRLGYGQTRPRTDAMWQYLVAQGLTGSWPHGGGDGLTTYTMPDFRGYGHHALDNQGGTSAGRVTTASGITGTSPGAVGGSQFLMFHGHGLSLSDPGHNHGHSDPGHAHSISDPGHGHGVSDPGHAHGVSDPGHAHSYNQSQFGSGNFVQGGSALQLNTSVGATTGGSGTGIGIFGSGTGISIGGSGTGIGIFAAGTGMSNVAAGTGMGGSVSGAGAGGSQNMPPTMMGYCFIYVGG